MERLFLEVRERMYEAMDKSITVCVKEVRDNFTMSFVGIPEEYNDNKYVEIIMDMFEMVILKQSVKEIVRHEKRDCYELVTDEANFYIGFC